MLAWLMQVISALLFRALSYLALASWFSGAWPRARCAEPRGRAAWECAGNSIIPALLCSVVHRTVLVANLTGIISPYFWTRGRKMLLVTFAE